MEVDNFLIVKLLHELGLSSKLKGFGYLKDIIDSLINSDTKTFKMCDLYEDISNKYETKSSTVTKCIKECIEKSWNNGNIDLISEVFGYSTGYDNDCPSNSMYVNSVLDYLRGVII